MGYANGPGQSGGPSPITNAPLGVRRPIVNVGAAGGWNPGFDGGNGTPVGGPVPIGGPITAPGTPAGGMDAYVPPALAPKPGPIATPTPGVYTPPQPGIPAPPEPGYPMPETGGSDVVTAPPKLPPPMPKPAMPGPAVLPKANPPAPALPGGNMKPRKPFYTKPPRPAAVTGFPSGPKPQAY